MFKAQRNVLLQRGVRAGLQSLKASKAFLGFIRYSIIYLSSKTKVIVANLRKIPRPPRPCLPKLSVSLKFPEALKSPSGALLIRKVTPAHRHIALGAAALTLISLAAIQLAPTSDHPSSAAALSVEQPSLAAPAPPPAPSAATAQTAEDSKDWLKQGVERLEADDPIGAEYPLLQAIQTSEREHDPVTAISATIKLGVACLNRGDETQGAEMLRRAARMAEQITDNARLAEAYTLLGEHHFTRGELDQAEASAQKGLQAAEIASEKPSIIRAHITLANISGKKGDEAKANTFMAKACELSAQTPGAPRGSHCADSSHLDSPAPVGGASPQSLARMWLDDGKKLAEAHDAANARTSLRKALKFAQAAKDKDAIATTASELGYAYKEENNLSDAEGAFTQSLSLYEEMGASEGIAHASSGLASVLRMLGRYSDATKMCQKAIRLDETAGRQPDLAKDYNTLAFIHLANGKFGLAEQFHTKALEIQKQLHSDPETAESYANLGQVYYKRGDLDRAADMFKRAIALEGSDDLTVSAGMNYSNLGAVYTKKGDSTAACAYWKKSSELLRKKDSPKSHLKANIHRVEQMLHDTACDKKGDTPALTRKFFSFLTN